LPFLGPLGSCVPHGTFKSGLKKPFSHRSPVARRKRLEAPRGQLTGRLPSSGEPSSSAGVLAADPSTGIAPQRLRLEGWEVVSPNPHVYWGFGERGRNRTYNLLIKSQLLCQLSYAPVNNLQRL
jgi:hypothetical protein